MATDVSLSLSLVYAFVLILGRVAGALVLVPIPGVSMLPPPARIVFVAAVSAALLPVVPAFASPAGLGQLVLWLLGEIGFGMSAGLLISFLPEALVMSGQMIGLQAGYSFASTVDPTTQADSSVLSNLAQMLASLLFFAFDLHHEVLRAFAISFAAHPPGDIVLRQDVVEMVLRAGSGIFAMGLRLALPIVALLLTIDIALALLSRLSPQLQLITLAYPLKMLGALVFLATLVRVYPHLYSDYAGRLLETLRAVMR